MAETISDHEPFPFNFHDPGRIAEMTAGIRENILELSDSFNENTLEMVFRLYDHLFFQGYFERELGEMLSFRVSSRMTHSAGKMSLRRIGNHSLYEICISGRLIFESFPYNKNVIINGLPCRDSIDALLRVLEHEAVHLLEYIVFGKTTCRGKRFRHLAEKIFGHRGVNHNLKSPVEKTCTAFRKGEPVQFHYKKMILTGFIYRKNSRATVMVRDSAGDYMDRKGNRYSRYYVPYTRITAIKEKVRE